MIWPLSLLKRQPEQRKFTIEDELLGPAAPGNFSGVPVSPKTALGLDTIWRAVSLISQDIAALKMEVFRRVDESGKERDRSHGARRVLRIRANPMQTWFTFCRALMVQVLLRGNGYAWIVRDGNGMVTRLVPLDSAVTGPNRDQRQTLESLHYLTVINGERATLDPNDVFHISTISDFSDTGESIVSRAANAIGLSLALERYGATFFRNDGRPGVVLRHPGKVDKPGREAIAESWRKGFTGENARKVAVLFEGMEIDTVGARNDEAQFNETIQERVRVVANLFGLPPTRLGSDTRTSFASLEAEEKFYLRNTLDPWLVAFEEEAKAKLLTPRQVQADSHIIEYNRRAIARGLMLDRAQFYNTGILGGWLSPNEVRAAENMNPIPGGDVFNQQAQMQPIADEPEPEPEPEGDENDQDEEDRRAALEEVLEGAVARSVERIWTQARKGRVLQTEANSGAFYGSVSPILRAMGVTDTSGELLFAAITGEISEWKEAKDTGGLSAKISAVVPSSVQRRVGRSPATLRSSTMEPPPPNSDSETGELSE